MDETQDPLAAILADRNQKYGHFYVSHKNAGRIWAAMLSHHLGQPVPDLPPHLVALMMASFKLLRASFPGGKEHEDNYLDARGYSAIAWDCVLWEKNNQEDIFRPDRE